VSHDTRRSASRLQLVMFTVVLVAMFGAAYALPMPQESEQLAATAEKRALTIDDYPNWRSIIEQQVSDDGKWMSFVLRFNNRADDETEPVLHILELETGVEIEVKNATGGVFSKDSKWIAYDVDPSGGGGRGGRRGRGRGGEIGEGEHRQEAQGRERGDDEDEPRRAELRNLSTGDVRSWQDIESFDFSASSTHLILRRRSPEPEGGGRGSGGGSGGSGGGRGDANNDDEPKGVDVVVHDLTTGRDQLLGSVGEVSFSKEGDLLAYTIDATVKESNGLFVLDLADARTIVLDNGAVTYSRLTWNEEGTALAVLKGKAIEEMRERENVLMAFPDLSAAIGGGGATSASPAILDPSSAAGFPEGWVVSERGAVSWSKDNARVFFGMKEQVEEPEKDEEAEDEDEVASVDIWNTIDERVQSRQIRQANTDRNFTYRQAFDVANGAYIKLADKTMRDLDVAQEGKWAVGRDTREYIHDYLPSRADIYRVDTTTGERTLMLENKLIGSHVLGISIDGRYYVYWDNDHVQAYDLDAGTNSTLGGSTAPIFIDTEFDRAGPRPSYGVAGYTEDGSGVIMQHRYDLWLLPYDGSDARNLTNGIGAEREIRFRYINPVPDDDQPGGGGGRFGRGRRPQKIDLAEPITLSAYGQWTKKAGFYKLDGVELTEVVYEDATFSTPRRAADAETYLFTRQTFAEFPDLRVSGPDFADSRKITDANPQQAEFSWGHRILFDFENNDGVRLQGILALPDDYIDGEKRPMIVTFYEKSSQGLHRYSSPSYLGGMGSSPIQAVSEGYVTMLPDIHFRTGASHSDMLECVEAAVRKVIEMGYVDPERIAVSGHSYGGEGAAFIGVRSEMFAAVGMGAGVTDLYSDFNQNWGWTYNIEGGSGSNAHNYYLYGQGREAVTPWENPELYRYESAITHAPDAKQPFLIMHGTDDPTVAFQNGLGFYNALRFNGKTAILLAYPGEGHGLRRMPNRRDLTIRYFEFFNHYLKDAPAAEWMTQGVPLLEKDQR